MRIKKTPPKEKTSIAIIVDGETEKWYLSQLQNWAREQDPSFNLKIEPELAKGLKLEDVPKYLKEKKELHKKIFWVIDLDVILKEDKEYKGKGQKPSDKLKSCLNTFENDPIVEIVINNPCLEFCLLLHYKYTTQKFNSQSGKSACDDATDNLSDKKCLPNYTKTKKYYTSIFKTLLDKLPTAIKNAKKIGIFDSTDPDKSISEMYKIFDYLNQEYKSIFS